MLPLLIIIISIFQSKWPPKQDYLLHLRLTFASKLFHFVIWLSYTNQTFWKTSENNKACLICFLADHCPWWEGMASQRTSTISEYLCTILGLDHAQRFNHQLIQKNKITWPTLLVRHTVIFVLFLITISGHSQTWEYSLCKKIYFCLRLLTYVKYINSVAYLQLGQIFRAQRKPDELAKRPCCHNIFWLPIK